MREDLDASVPALRRFVQGRGGACLRPGSFLPYPVCYIQEEEQDTYSLADVDKLEIRQADGADGERFREKFASGAWQQGQER